MQQKRRKKGCIKSNSFDFMQHFFECCMYNSAKNVDMFHRGPCYFCCIIFINYYLTNQNIELYELNARKGDTNTVVLKTVILKALKEKIQREETQIYWKTTYSPYFPTSRYFIVMLNDIHYVIEYRWSPWFMYLFLFLRSEDITTTWPWQQTPILKIIILKDNQRL